MRILMLGTGPFAVPTLTWLLDSAHDVPALITRPTPSPRGREKASPNPMRDLAESRHLPVHAPESINSPEAHQLIRSLAPELLMVCDYGQILSPETLSLTPLGGINLHGSLLPKYRGAAPVHWAILNGDAETGVTVIHMTPRLDGGPILAMRRTPIGSDETMAELERRLASLGVEAVQEAIEKLAGWDRTSLIGAPQDKSKATKAPRLKKTDGIVDWSRSALDILNQVRALKPWPTTYSHWLRPDGEPLRLILDGVSVVDSDRRAGRPGEIVLRDESRLHVATGRGVLALDCVQPAGKRVLEIAEFLRGYPLQVGQCFGDPERTGTNP
jgi:methionyl-tRNA formyltransferase